jgi:nitroreductase
MSELLQAIQNRRSIRQFIQEEIPQDKVEKILEAGRWAQSWANTQCWEVIVVQDTGVKQRLQETLPKSNPGAQAITQAPLVLSLGAELKKSGYFKGQAPTKFGDWFMFDMGIINQNICLAAHALGLGSVVIGLFDQDKAKQIVGLPDGYELVTLTPIGYPAQEAKSSSRKTLQEFTHHNMFGTPYAISS